MRDLLCLLVVRKGMGRVLLSVVALIAFSVCCAAAILAGIYPHRPSSAAGWVVLMSLGVPFYLAAEFLR